MSTGQDQRVTHVRHADDALGSAVLYFFIRVHILPMKGHTDLEMVFFFRSCFPEPDHQDLGSHVRITLSYSNVHGMINSITEVPEVSVQLAGQQTRLHLGV